MNEFEERLSQEDERAAERFAAALDALDAGRSLAFEPAEAPALYEALRATSRLQATAAQIEPRAAYRVRSRALLIDAALALARRRERSQPVISRSSFLVPFATAAAAAGLTIAAVLAATALGYGPNGDPAPDSMVATNLTRRSIQDDLQVLQTTLDAVVASAHRGEELDPVLLRSIAETTLSVTALIERSPQAVRNEDVILYFQAAAATTLRLGEIAPLVSSPPATSALGTARRASEDAVIATSLRLQAMEEELAAGHRSPS
jgi:hypothetical protein